MSLSAKEFYELLPIEFHNAIKDWNEYKEAEIMAPVKAEYESMRWLAMWINNQNPHRRREIKKPENIISFSWDKEVKQQSVDDMKEQLYALVISMGGTINDRNKN